MAVQAVDQLVNFMTHDSVISVCRLCRGYFRLYLHACIIVGFISYLFCFVVSLLLAFSVPMKQSVVSVYCPSKS